MDLSLFVLELLKSLPDWTADAFMLVVVTVIALLAFGRTFVYLINAYRTGIPVPQAVNEGVDILIDTIDGSPLDIWLEKQIIAGKLPDSLVPIIKTVSNVANDNDLETETTALPKLSQYINTLMDGDLST